jgi:carotenoid 1,2-hydratase
MRLVVNPADDAAHGEWLRTKAGAYEWWYFDALSDDGEWALTCIWFLGNPFSPYYRLSALGNKPDPFAHNALFFALYRQGRLHAYHFTRFPRDQVCADERRPATLRFGPNDLSYADGRYVLHLDDENANRRSLSVHLVFHAPPLLGQSVAEESRGDNHFWLPAAPACWVAGQITLREKNNPGAEIIAFRGSGYHDHNWGTLPFAANIRDWYWARVGLGEGKALVLYHVNYRQSARPVSHLLRFDGGQLKAHDDQPEVHLRRTAFNGFATGYATHLHIRSGELAADFWLGRRLDSAPFYIRALCCANVSEAGRTQTGMGIGEYFRPQILSWPLVASAMKARIVER